MLAISKALTSQVKDLYRSVGAEKNTLAEVFAQAMRTPVAIAAIEPPLCVVLCMECVSRKSRISANEISGRRENQLGTRAAAGVGSRGKNGHFCFSALRRRSFLIAIKHFRPAECCALVFWLQHFYAIVH